MCPSSASEEAGAPSRGRRPRKRDLTREEILRVAARLFRKKGYRATSLQEVADHFGVQRPAIYYYFRSKAEILGEINDRFLDVLVAQLDEIAQLEIDADEKLGRVIAGQVELFAANVSELAVFLNNEAELPPKLRRQALQMKRSYQEKLEDIFRQGVAEGRFADLDPHIATFTLLGMTNWMYRWYRPNGRSSPAEVAEIITHMARRGLLTVDG